MFLLKDHLEKLPAFHAAAKTGSISLAAEQLHVSQAALSHAIKVLEEALKTELFRRRPRGVELTDAGKVLFDFSKNLLPQLEMVETKIRTPHEEFSGKLRVGTHETLAVHLWPNVLERYFTQHPQMSVSLTSGRVDNLISALRNQDYHLVVTIEPFGHTDILTELLFENRLAFFAAPINYPHRYPALKKGRITLKEANEIPILTDVQGHQEQFMPIPRMLLNAGIVAEQPFELNSFEATAQLAEKGLGIALLPEGNATHVANLKKLREIEIEGLPKNFGKYRVCASRLPSGALSAAVSALIQELKRGGGT